MSREKELPRLAWSLSLASHRLTVGSDVEVNGDTCFEGARSGDLVKGYNFGSGVVRKARGYLCVPPTHTLDGLYLVVPNSGGTTVTNSLVWALRTAGVTAADSPRFTGMMASLRTSTQGILGYKRLILTKPAVSVLQMLYSPFALTDSRYAERSVAFPAPERLDFAGYKAQLLEVIRATLAYSPRFTRLLSTCSSGYDSPACTALAKEVGVERALTVATGRGGKDDSGATPAKEMGVPVEVYERPGEGLERFSERVKDWFIDLESMSEAGGEDYSEFVATFANHGDVFFKPFEGRLPGSVLLTGFHGAIWDYMSHTGPWVRRGDTSGCGLNEYRLRVGFVHLPLPYVAARSARAIERLSQSAEMRPWNFGNPYNRPIPRRLGEEAGAARESFGIRKKAANVMVECRTETLADAYEQVAARYM